MKNVLYAFVLPLLMTGSLLAMQHNEKKVLCCPNLGSTSTALSESSTAKKAFTFTFLGAGCFFGCACIATTLIILRNYHNDKLHPDLP